jgi:hypothetical protein
MAATHYDSTSALLRRIEHARHSRDGEVIAQEIARLEGAIQEWEYALEKQPSRGLTLRCAIARRCVRQLTERLEGIQHQ